MPNRATHTKKPRPYYDRAVETIEPRQRFLIVCEGEKTEPNYFKKFRVHGKVEPYAKGVGYDPLSLVKEALNLREEDEYDQVWCVFDRDSWSPQDFNEAIALAGRNGIKVAYTNVAFELWYLLHFNYHDAALSREQ